MVDWYRSGTPMERKTFWACFGGWALDALDVQLFSLVIPTLLGLWQISRADAGLVTGVTLVASALGGWVGGAISDRIGRVRALQVMILWFATATGLSALAQDYHQLLALKALQGLGFGGEWAAGVALMSEAIRPKHRGRALASVQSAWALGWGAAVLLFTLASALLPPRSPGGPCSPPGSPRPSSWSGCAGTSPSQRCPGSGPRPRGPRWARP